MRALLPVTGGRDQKIAAIAQEQRGRVSRRQLLAAGITDSMIHTMLAHGWLHRLHQGVYAVGHLAPIDRGRETAALLTSRGDAILSHLTAAGMWKLRSVEEGAPVDIALVGNETVRRAGIKAHRIRHLHPRDVRILERLPVTSPARTLLDIAELLTARELERAIDEALVRRIVRVNDVEEVLSRSAGRRGAPALSSLLDQRRHSTITRSEGEERFLALVRSARLPPPQLNVRMHGFTVDFLWPPQRVVVEVDGYQFHRTRSAFERDRRKDAVLKGAGLDVTRVTRRQMDEEPYAVIARLARTLALDGGRHQTALGDDRDQAA